MNLCVLYAHYYLGCRYRFTWPDGEFVEAIIEWTSIWRCTGGDNLLLNKARASSSFDIDDLEKDGIFQLFLIDPCDMPKDMKKEYYSLCNDIRDDNGVTIQIADTPKSLDFLFKNGVDAFELIRNGHAIKIESGMHKKDEKPLKHKKIDKGREIKFRCWDSLLNKMVAYVGYAVIGEFTMFNLLDEWIRENPIEGVSTLERYATMIEMQYTGLKDKAGAEIYEGDIVSAGKTQLGKLLAWAVIFHFDGWKIGKGNKTPSRPVQYFWKKVEIIGNMYEHPELIGQL